MNPRPEISRTRTGLPRIAHAGVALAALLAAIGCSAVGPDYAPPEADVPAGWQEPEDAGLAPRAADLAQWWSRLEDPALDRLVERAIAQSLDLDAAEARVREARALRGASKSALYPSVDADAAYERREDSATTAFGRIADLGAIDRYSAGLDAAWEIDLWGRVRRSVEAADADLAATVEDARDVAVSVVAETALAYVELRAFQRRLDIARTNVALQEQTLALANARFESGLSGERDVAQASTNLESTRARVPALEHGVRTAQNRLAVLLGLAPGALARELESVEPIPVPPLEVAVGVPADLLRRRADVRRAERELAGETARIGVAEGDLYPRVALNGTLGLASDDLSDLAEEDSSFFGIGPSLRWNLFDAGWRRRRVEAQAARRDQAFARFERAVLVALEEAENAMSGFVREQVRRGSLAAAAEHARRAVEFSRTQYTEGLADFQAVLDSERSLAAVEDDLAQSDAAVATRFVALYKALGGGWEHAPLESAVGVARAETAPAR